MAIGRLAAWLVVAAAGGAAGCAAARPGAAVDARDAPRDFSLDVFVSGGAAAPETALGALRGRYVVLPDGSLHSSAAPGPDAGWLPECTRTLGPEHMQALWALCREAGLLDPGASHPLADPARARPAGGKDLVYVAITSDGRRWNFGREIDAGTALDPPIVALVERLAALAWTLDRETRAAEPPRRYDFGPDPYARYRSAR